jgi:hypothetical protein
MVTMAHRDRVCRLVPCVYLRRGYVEVRARALMVTVARRDLWQPDDTDDPGPKGTFRALLKV